MNDTDRPENERVAFCQNCGRPLNTGEVRNVGSAIFCEPCLIAKVSAAEAATSGAPGASSSSYGAAGGPPPPPTGTGYGAAGSVPPSVPPRVPSEPNPGLAALLGFIPGVGAFYNGQYAKGIVHLVVFAVLTSLADHSGIFVLFVAGWIFYQVIEAHHTARARRDGTPLPNPFGLNDIGERLGFGRAWPGAPATGVHVPPASTVPPSSTAYSAYGAAGYAPPVTEYAAPPASGYAAYPPPPPAAAWGASAETYAPVPPPVPFPPVSGLGSRVPTGAILLIGLGVVFLIGNSGLFRGFPVQKLIPFLLIGLGVWLFVRKMTEMGGGLADDGTASYRVRLFRAARGPVWIVLVGVLFLLDTFNILSWGRSWPLFIIVGGLMTFFERTAYSAVVPPPAQYAYGTEPQPPVAPEPSAPRSAGIVPVSSQERERE